MGAYLDRIAALPQDHRWPEVHRLIFSEPLPFLSELRAECPVMVLDRVTLVTRLADCMLVLRRPQTFGVDLYVPKQGGYFMAQDDTPVHWREKSLMKAVLDVEDIPAIRDWVAARTSQLIQTADGPFDMVRRLSRGVPVALVQEWFGLDRSDPDKLIEWSFWNQQDAFWNQPFDDVRPGIDQPAIRSARERANVMMAIYLGRLVARRSVRIMLGLGGGDPATRIVRLAMRGKLRFNRKDAIFNIGGLLIGAVETTSHAVCNALAALGSDPARLADAREAAAADDPRAIDGHVFEALRFRPAFPYFFRVCRRDTTVCADTPFATVVPAGNVVLAVTQSGMFDPAGFPDPDRFDPGRDFSDTFTFGHGHHACLGRHVAAAMVPEIVRQILRHDLDLAAGPDFAGSPVPQCWMVARQPSA
ncbi:cytochrome P450 [Paracoccus beibuensis]|uniref:cytochrome P450 n=1 Tax=Paracoccus beibuensis TaxID=547602 RepID=UPI00223EB403|nr:cytochrome P450 [Paracoccus beibuensis]